ncbi:hypothetical protein [Thioclava sp.]|uniref:hypothetical protein n=1 Tax=Thioclava sp. TaxID=1933450 RepID=UPI003AA96781
MRKTVLKASAHGSLDGLCGVYANINASELMLKRSLKEYSAAQIAAAVSGRINVKNYANFVISDHHPDVVQ